jgi:hypothetical protein
MPEVENAINRLSEAVAELRVKQAGLDDYRRELAANQVRLEDKIDKLRWWIMTTLAASLGGIAAHFIAR